MRVFLWCCIFFTGSTISVLALDEEYFTNAVKFKCVKEREIKGCNTTGQTVDLSDIGIYLFTERDRKNAEPLHLCGGRLPDNTFFDRQKKVVVFIGGFLGSVCLYTFPWNLKEQIIFRDGSNFILVDWFDSFGENLDYYVAMKLTKPAAEKISFVLQNIIKQTGISAERFHIIGHSLGAQCAGITGHLMKEDGFVIRRITALDPAGPGFRDVPLEGRIDRTDARMVDVIHTNYGKCLPHLGDDRPVGHNDFYIIQKKLKMSCLLQSFKSFLRKDPLVGLFTAVTPICPHFVILEIFKSTINPCYNCLLIGVKCDSEEDYISGRCKTCRSNGSRCAEMGMYWEHYPRAEGNGTHSYYLETSMDCPFCYNNTKIDTSGYPKKPTDGTPVSCFPSGKTV